MAQIDINIIRPAEAKKSGSHAQPDIVWPTWDEEDEGEPTLVELTLYDYATYLLGGEWYGVDDWDNDDITEVVWEDTKTFLGQYNKPFHIAPRSTIYKVHGNTDSKVRANVISREFSSSNEKRWERKPLSTRSDEWRYEGNRWYAGGTYIWINPETGATEIKSDYSQFNIRVELVSSADAVASLSIDPDSYHDGVARRMKMKYPQATDGIQPCVYRAHIPGQRLGIKVSDQSKSFAHFVGNGLAYGYEWIDSIYFCPFNTADSVNFKVTAEPSFDSGEVSGKMISPGKWDVGLIPRRWLYYVRYRHQQNPKTDYDEWTYTGLSPACQSYFSSMGSLEDNAAIKFSYNSGTGKLESYKSISTHHVAYFWGRFPPNFTPQWGHVEGTPTVEDTSPVAFFNESTHAYIGTSDLIWSETYEQAQAHFVEAGGDTEEAELIRCGGLSCNLHVCSDSSDYVVKIGTSTSTAYGTLSQIACASYGGPVVTRTTDGNAYMGFTHAYESPHFGVQALWDVIEGSAIWQDTLMPLRDAALAMTDDNTPASRIDMVPWGVAISPSKTGDLVGIVKIREKPYFVWRKADEEITPKVVGSTTNPIRFESNKVTGEIGPFTEGNYGNLLAESSENLYDADICDLFVGDAARKLTHVGRDVTSTVDEVSDECDVMYTTYAEGAEEGAVALHAAAYVMVTKEHAFDDIDYTDEALDGWNIRLMGRCARCNEFGVETADTRNSY